jgi:hypothetical protein
VTLQEFAMDCKFCNGEGCHRCPDPHRLLDADPDFHAWLDARAKEDDEAFLAHLATLDER